MVVVYWLFCTVRTLASFGRLQEYQGLFIVYSFQWCVLLTEYCKLNLHDELNMIQGSPQHAAVELVIQSVLLPRKQSSRRLCFCICLCMRFCLSVIMMTQKVMNGVLRNLLWIITIRISPSSSILWAFSRAHTSFRALIRIVHIY